MKNLILLGQFDRNVGLKYQSLLVEAGINVVVEDWSNSLEVSAGFSLIRLLVSIQDYEKSLSLIKEFEIDASKRLMEPGQQSAGKALLKTILGIIFRSLIILGVIFAVSHVFKIYKINTAKKLFKEAKTEYKRGDFAQALKDYTKFINMFPYTPSAYFNRGLTYNKLGNPIYAIADFYKVIEFDPDDMKAYNGIGLSFYHLGNFNKAIEFFSNAIEINPRDGKAYVNRGLVYDKQKNYAQAITDFTQATILNPQDPIAYNDLGYACAEQGNLSQAFQYLDKAIEIEPHNKYAFSSRAYAYFKEKEYDKAWNDVHKAQALGPISDKEFLILLEELKKFSGRDK